MICPHCHHRIAPGDPVPASAIKPGDRIKLSIEQAPASVVTSRPYHGDRFVRIVDHTGETWDYYLGADHTVWRL
jgi:hypothetical protein